MRYEISFLFNKKKFPHTFTSIEINSLIWGFLFFFCIFNCIKQREREHTEKKSQLSTNFGYYMFWFWIILNGTFCTCIGVCPFVKLLLTSTIKKKLFSRLQKGKFFFSSFRYFFKVPYSLIKLTTIFSIHKDFNLFSSHSILYLTTLTPRLFFKNWINIFSCLRFDWVVKTVMLTLFQKKNMNISK